MPQTVIAKRSLIIKNTGRLIAINEQNTSKTVEILVLLDRDIKKYWFNSNFEIIYVKIGDLVQVGNFLSSKTISSVSGQVCEIEDNYILIRLASIRRVTKGILLSSSIFHGQHLLGLEQIGTDLGFLERTSQQRAVTNSGLSGALSGIKRVEFLLEARLIDGCLLAPCAGKASIFWEYNKKGSPTKRFLSVCHPSGKEMTVRIDADLEVNFQEGEYVNLLQGLSAGPFSSHDLLSTLYNYYLCILGDTAEEACKKSFAQVRLYLLQEVQNVFTSQSVHLSSKHTEVIIKQLTLRVCVIYGGGTTLLTGEVITTAAAFAIANSLKSSGRESLFQFKPILLGLTKASLNSDSFISAASFQETTRVLTDAAIEGKRDWLYGLKENVIIGRLIPAGTGFNCFENLKKVGRERSSSIFLRPKKEKNLKSSLLNLRITQKKP
jgi:DNA-directed RNA polymerase subunit beta'